MKNLVTFTNVIPEWHPLNAAHFGPCNNCNNAGSFTHYAWSGSNPCLLSNLSCCSWILFSFLFFFLVFLPFLGPLLWHMEVPRLGV